jgi:hypothetical protein
VTGASEMARAAWLRCGGCLVLGVACAIFLANRSSESALQSRAEAAQRPVAEYATVPAALAAVQQRLHPPRGFARSTACAKAPVWETPICFRKARSVVLSDAQMATLVTQAGATLLHGAQLGGVGCSRPPARSSRSRLALIVCHGGATLGATRLLFLARSLVLADARSIAGSTRRTRF